MGRAINAHYLFIFQLIECNNKKEIHKENLIYKTQPLTSDILDFGNLNRTEPIYALILDKGTHRLEIKLDSGYQNTETNNTTLMNKKAEQLAKTIYKDAKRLSVEYGSESDSTNNSVTSGYYNYLVNPNGKTDEERNMSIQLLPDGIIVHISLPLILKK